MDTYMVDAWFSFFFLFSYSHFHFISSGSFTLPKLTPPVADSTYFLLLLLVFVITPGLFSVFFFLLWSGDTRLMFFF